MDYVVSVACRVAQRLELTKLSPSAFPEGRGYS